MKTLKKLKVLSAVAAGAVVACGLTGIPSYAAGTSVREEASGRERLLERARQHLGLSGEQVSQIKSVFRGEREVLKGLLFELRDARARLGEAIGAGDANEASVRAASARLALVQADLAVERLKLRQKITPILTVEQREKLRDFRSGTAEIVDALIGRLVERPSE